MSIRTISWIINEPHTLNWVLETDETIALIEKKDISIMAAVIGPPGQDGMDGNASDPGDLVLLWNSV